MYNGVAKSFIPIHPYLHLDSLLLHFEASAYTIIKMVFYVSLFFMGNFFCKRYFLWKMHLM